MTTLNRRIACTAGAAIFALSSTIVPSAMATPSTVRSAPMTVAGDVVAIGDNLSIATAVTYINYTVKSGDSFWAIGQKFGLTAQQVAAANGMTINSMIHPGQVLRIPSTSTTPAPTPAPAPAPTTYTVKSGDSWWSISQKFGMTPQALASLNGKTINSIIHPGDILKVSATTSVTNPNPAPIQVSARRQLVLDRANDWVRRGITYDWDRSETDRNGKYYRRDCSGFVSMAWDLGVAPSTVYLPNYFYKISKDQLQPGDVIGNMGPGTEYANGHVAIFIGWADAAKTRAKIVQMSGPKYNTANYATVTWGSSFWTKQAWRRNGF